EREHVLAGHDELGARRNGIDLRAAGQFELIHGVERLLDGRAAGEQAVVTHDQRIVRAEIADDALALVELHRRPFIVDSRYGPQTGSRSATTAAARISSPTPRCRRGYACAARRQRPAAPCGWSRGSRSP